MKRAMLIVLVLAGVATGQATQPSPPTVEDLKARLIAALSDNAKQADTILSLKRQVAAMKAEHEKAIAKVVADRDAALARIKELTPPSPDDRIAAAIKAHRPALGMTQAQLAQSATSPPKLRGEGIDYQVFTLIEYDRGVYTEYTVTLRDGKVVEVDNRNIPPPGTGRQLGDYEQLFKR
ncbi:MAG: hypothetical protein NTW19_06840 [Planctomycetota bacterium]|nr:hypothetical protein [Planctomycetota bacterium]